MVDGRNNAKGSRGTFNKQELVQDHLSVGRTLKSHRELRGQTLAEVSHMLRIHRDYLHAIEENEIEKLPGTTYAVGFVRSYAEHLGLDGSTISEWFKEEGKMLDRRAELVFPLPMPEGQTPGLIVLLSAAVLLSIVYGGWVFMSSSNDEISNLIPDLPEEFAAFLSNDKSMPTIQSPATTVSSAQNAGEGPNKSSNDPTIRLNQNNILNPQSGNSIKTEREKKISATNDVLPDLFSSQQPSSDTNLETASTQMAFLDPSDKNGLDQDPLAVSVRNIIESTRDTQISKTEISRSPTSLDSKFIESYELKVNKMPALSPQMLTRRPRSSQPDNLKTNSKIENAFKVDPQISDERSSILNSSLLSTPTLVQNPQIRTRIKIKANSDSWVEIRNSEEKLLTTGVLRKGQIYNVPDVPGLLLDTGNAGGLIFIIDGKITPVIGPLGTVRRNVNLNPTSLKNGTAYNQ